MAKFYLLLLYELFFFAGSLIAAKEKTLTPLDYGLTTALTGNERYLILQKCHQDAIRKGLGVNYKDIDTLNIEIPDNAESIPLPYFTDFAGVVFNVKNCNKDITMFTMENKVEQYSCTWEIIEKNQFNSSDKDFLIIIDDIEPWVQRRKGYDYGHNRNDILWVHNNVIQNSVVSSYSTPASKPYFYKCRVNNKKKIIKGFTFNRDILSTYITYPLGVINENNVDICDIVINTPISNLYGDHALLIKNCTNVRLEDVTINGTYSQKDMYGYGIRMNNVWNVTYKNLKAAGNWGVFGCNNVNTVNLMRCDINRFDIHCYGKDITFKKCVFRDLYNQFSSFYGRLCFKGCTFINFIPVLIEPSYNAYTGFEIDIKNCKWQVIKRHPFFIMVGNPAEGPNSREELREKCWPNLMIKNLSLVLPDGIKNVTLYKADGDSSSPIGYINKVCINGIKLIGQDKLNVSFTNKKVKFKNKIEHKLNRCLGIDYFN